MTYSSLSDAVTGFKSDADRVDTFGNGDANATYTSKTGAIVPSIQNLIGQWNYSINVAANGILAQSTAQANAAAASASASAGSASASAGSATSAAASQGAAAGSAASAAASAAGALSSQNAAATSEANAASSATNVSALLASFRGAFLGAFASDSAAVAFAAANSITLVSGVMYENTTGNKFRIYNGSAWGDYDASAQASQSAASLSAANAAGSAAAAANSQSNAAMSELSSAGSASSAATSAAGALASLTDFKGRWFGGLASDPALDLNGNPLAAGDAYFNTTLNQTRTYTGSAWQAPFSPTDSGTVSFQQAATGAALRWLQTKARERVSVDDFTGVDPTGATDSYAGFVNANAYCTATGKELFGQGTYLLNSMPVLSCDCDFWTATFNIPGTRAIGVELSTGSSTNPTDNLICKRIRLGNIVNTTKPSTGWAGQGIGVRAVNLLTCDVLIKQIKDFGVGLRETAYQTGCAYNEIKVLYYENSKVNLQIQPGDAVGYTNESNHYGGRYHFRDAEGVNVAGTRHIQILPFDVTNATASWPNNHSFHKPSLEGNVPEYHVEIGGDSNTFAYGRWEATAPKVLLTGHASNVSKTSKNIFVGGYQTDLVVFTTTGVSTGGDIIHPRKWVHNGFGAGAVFRNTGGDVQNTPLLRGYASDQVIANAAGTDANWSWNLYTAALQGKITADAYERVRLEFSTGRLYLGSGGSAPTKYIGGAGSFINFSLDLVPTADNTLGLGFTSLRWSTVYAGTGTINTSDEREKQDINPISDDVLDAWSDVQFVQYRWRDAVESKGDAARKHIGVIAQRVHEAFAARGLDAFSYGLLCFDEWHDAFEDIPATYDDTGAVDENGAPVLSLAEPAKRVQTVVAGNRWGIRADECLFLEAALMRRELNRLRSA